MNNGWIIARDHKTNFNLPREYRTADLLWSERMQDAKRFTAKERNAEMTWLKARATGNWDLFFYKD